MGQPINFSRNGQRPGPAHKKFHSIGRRPAWPINVSPDFHPMGRGPAQPVKCFEDGPRPRPAHHFSTWHGPARPGPLIFQVSCPGPAHDIGSEAHETRALYGPARHFCGPARGKIHGPAHLLSRTKRCMLTCFFNSCFSLSSYFCFWVPCHSSRLYSWASCIRPRGIHTHSFPNKAPPMARPDGFCLGWWTTLLLLLLLQSSQQQQ